MNAETRRLRRLLTALGMRDPIAVLEDVSDDPEEQLLRRLERVERGVGIDGAGLSLQERLERLERQVAEASRGGS